MLVTKNLKKKSFKYTKKGVEKMNLAAKKDVTIFAQCQLRIFMYFFLMSNSNFSNSKL